MSRHLAAALLASALLTGCADVMHRTGANGLTRNQQTDLVLFEIVARYARDSLGGPLSIDGRLSNAGWPTVGLEPDGRPADADRATAARRAVLHRLGIPETMNATGNGCGTAWALTHSPGHHFICPDRLELRVLIGPFYPSRNRSDSQAVGAARLYANVVETWIGPEGFQLRSMDYEMTRTGSRWRISNRFQRDSIGLCDHSKVRPFDDCR